MDAAPKGLAATRARTESIMANGIDQISVVFAASTSRRLPWLEDYTGLHGSMDWCTNCGIMRSARYHNKHPHGTKLSAADVYHKCDGRRRIKIRDSEPAKATYTANTIIDGDKDISKGAGFDP